MEKQFLNGKKLKFMIVDDDVYVRELVSEILKINGQDVVEARNGADCIKKIKTKDKDVNVILLDIRMPGVGSKEIIKEVKINCPNALVIYLTSVKAFEPTREDIIKGWKPEIDYPVIGYIEKPVSQEEIIEKIEKFFERTKLIKNIIAKAKSR